MYDNVKACSSRQALPIVSISGRKALRICVHHDHVRLCQLLLSKSTRMQAADNTAVFWISLDHPLSAVHSLSNRLKQRLTAPDFGNEPAHR